MTFVSSPFSPVDLDSRLAGWRWEPNPHRRDSPPIRAHYRLQAPDGWVTEIYSKESEAVAEALRRVRSQSKQKESAVTATIAPSAASTQLALFNYEQLDVETRIVVRQRATEARDEIRRLASYVRQTAETVWALGEKLGDVQARLAPDGLFAAWCNAELPGVSRGTIYNAINVYRAFPELPTVGSAGEHLDVPLRALYLLAAPSTPAEAREAMIERVERGEAVSVADAQALVAAHKPTPPELEDEPLSDYEQAMEAAEEARQAREAAERLMPEPEPEPEPASEAGEVIATVPAPAVVVDPVPVAASTLTPVTLTPQTLTPLTPLAAAPTADAAALKQAEALVEILRMALALAECERDATRREFATPPSITIPDAAVEQAARVFLASPAVRGAAGFLAMSATMQREDS